MKKYRNIALAMVIILTTLILSTCGYYNYMLKPVTKDTKIKEITIPARSSTTEIANILKDNNLIKDVNIFKLYLKINKINNLKASVYQLSENMGVKKITEIISEGNNYNPESIRVTIPEGKHITEIANIYAKNTNNSAQSLLEFWNNKDFILEMIDKYWFIEKDVLNGDIRYYLEGYLFPDTYEYSKKDVTPKEIAIKMLDRMDNILSKYKSEIEKSSYTVHQILTLASIVEYEAILDEDRPMIAGVFYNRLNSGWLLQSCATVGYAIDEWKLSYTYQDLRTDSKYNTYYYKGLPVGPGNSPSEKSIIATLNPAKHDYYYFLANVCDTTSKKTYYSKTNQEHEQKKAKYLTCL